jgi:predicted component of type VI protein secretion system
MSLILKVISFKNQPYQEHKQITIDRYGGTIGRSENCALCLPDPEKFVSRHHATIKYSNGNYFLTDCSLSGTFINKQKLPLLNKSQQLFNNSHLTIGDYQLSVVITDEPTEETDLADFNAMANDSPTRRNKASYTDQLDSDIYEMTSEFAPDSEIICEQPSNQLENPDFFYEFLTGAELNYLDIQTTDPAKTMRKVGQMFKAMVKGSVAVLRSRAEFKSFFHVTRTILTPVNNNPLKAVVSINTILKQLLQDELVEDLDSVGAIEQGFCDVIDHQLAMQAGIQAALLHILESFDPEKVELQFNKGVHLTKQAKCWQHYKAEFPQISKSAVENFFGDEFAEAYENQMRILIMMRNKK